MKYLTIFFLLILTSLANAAPSVTWSPRSVVRTVSPGLAVVENVSFRSSADLANVRLRVLPALASLVTVIPSKLRVVHKHQDISVRLSITIPSGFPINNVLNGGIQVRVDNDNDTACGDGERAVREKEDLSTNGEQQRRCVLPVTLDIVRSSYRESDVGKIIKNANGSVFPSNELILTLTGDLGTADAQALASTVGGEVVGVAQSSKSYQVIVPTSTEQELNELISTLGAETGVASVLKNYVGTLFGAVTDLENLRSCNPTRDWPSAYDKIHAPEAWNFLESAPPGTTLNPITVGVIDSGLNRVHPEFASNVSLNPSGVPNEIDTVGHGTLVAGIIGANNLGITANCSTTDAQESGLQMNGIVSGVPGITYSLETRGSALPTWLKTLSLIDDLGSLRTANGTPRVPIINISLGYTECTISLFFSKSCILPLEFEIITHLFAVHVQSLPDILFITAAGEDDIDSANVTPANLGNVASTTNVLTVGATDPLDLRLSFASGTLRIVSNWGSTVGLSAPGFHVYGPVLGNSYSGGGRGSTFSSEVE